MSKSRKQLFSGIFSIVHILFFVVYLCLPDVDPLILVFLDTASRCNIPKVLWKHRCIQKVRVIIWFGVPGVQTKPQAWQPTHVWGYVSKK